MDLSLLSFLVKGDLSMSGLGVYLLDVSHYSKEIHIQAHSWLLSLKTLD